MHNLGKVLHCATPLSLCVLLLINDDRHFFKVIISFQWKQTIYFFGLLGDFFSVNPRFKSSFVCPQSLCYTHIIQHEFDLPRGFLCHIYFSDRAMVFTLQCCGSRLEISVGGGQGDGCNVDDTHGMWFKKTYLNIKINNFNILKSE